MNRPIKLPNLIGFCLLGIILTGCSTQSNMSKDDEDNFRHPKQLAPADQAKALANYQAETEKAIAARRAAGLPVPPAPPPMPGAAPATN